MLSLLHIENIPLACVTFDVSQLPALSSFKLPHRKNM